MLSRYSSECYCDNSFQNGACPVAGDPGVSHCDMACEGDSTSLCGGPDRLNVYFKPTTQTPTGWNDPVCYTDSRSSRTLGVAMTIDGGYAAMSVEKCLSACADAGYGACGLEYGRECYGSNIKDLKGAPSGDSGCNVLCQGNNAQICGGEASLSKVLGSDTPANLLTGSNQCLHQFQWRPCKESHYLFLDNHHHYYQYDLYSEPNSRHLHTLHGRHSVQ